MKPEAQAIEGSVPGLGAYLVKILQRLPNDSDTALEISHFDDQRRSEPNSKWMKVSTGCQWHVTE